jgi:hypothetical protein
MSLSKESTELIAEIFPFLNEVKGKQNFLKKKMINNTVKYIYNEIQQAQGLIKSLIENNKITQTIDIFEDKKNVELPSLFNSRFVVSYIKTYVKKHIYGTITLNVFLLGHTINIIFYLLEPEDDANYILGNPLILNIIRGNYKTIDNII